MPVKPAILILDEAKAVSVSCLQGAKYDNEKQGVLIFYTNESGRYTYAFQGDDVEEPLNTKPEKIIAQY